MPGNQKKMVQMIDTIKCGTKLKEIFIGPTGEECRVRVREKTLRIMKPNLKQRIAAGGKMMQRTILTINQIVSMFND